MGTLGDVVMFVRLVGKLMSPFRSYNNSDFMFETQYMVNTRDQYVDNDIFVDVLSRNLALSRWTTVSSDNRLVNHLLRLFFTWNNIVERAFYRPIFEADVVARDPQSADDHQGGFCSQFLINALLAVSCASYLPSYVAAVHHFNMTAVHSGPDDFQSPQ